MSTFSIGFLAVTRCVHQVSLEYQPFHHWVLDCINRFRNLDWGDTSLEDANLNSRSVIDGSRILSVYNIPDGYCGIADKIWVIAEAISPVTGQREYTTVLFPSDY